MFSELRSKWEQNEWRSSCKVSVIVVHFELTLKYVKEILVKLLITHLMQTRSIAKAQNYQMVS
jgi:hypothetical protein